ncbi:hypothetical protein DIPPA_02971 [Diplonema papillatum]|nr:hypothetical protein DIPPA_02971 [Diplonema papillatum]|eukprot:gene4493-6963_t
MLHRTPVRLAARAKSLVQYVAPQPFRKTNVPVSEVFEGNWKYVLLEVTRGDMAAEEMDYVVTQCPCQMCKDTEMLCDRSCFHKNLAKPTAEGVKKGGYKVWMAGGGWIRVDREKKTMHVHGISIAMGPADHEITANKLRESFPDFEVTFDEE